MILYFYQRPSDSVMEDQLTGADLLLRAWSHDKQFVLHSEEMTAKTLFYVPKTNSFKCKYQSTMKSAEGEERRLVFPLAPLSNIETTPLFLSSDCALDPGCGVGPISAPSPPLRLS
jgi:hypothetical protein